MSNEISIPVQVTGHLRIVDDLGNKLVDQHNAVHPQNLARIFARALSNEQNSFINRIAFGNGGTTVDAAFTVTYKTPNDGQSPDIATWDSRLYHETYSEIVDAGQVVLNPLIGTDPGSADLNTGVRSGGGAVPASDPISVPHVSGPGVRSTELGLVSQVVISSVLNSDEPRSQPTSDSSLSSNVIAPSGDFLFDEVGLYTSGAQAINTTGYQYIDVGNRISTDDTGLLPGVSYAFNIAVNGGTSVTITFTTPETGGSGAGGRILYGDLCQAINTGSTAWGFTGINPLPASALVMITDTTNGAFSTISGKMTFGFLKFESSTSGALSAIDLTGVQTNALLLALNPPIGGTLRPSVQGVDAGLQNSPTNAATERERLLTHICFAPVLKSANRILNITYTLTISVARTP